MDGGWKGKNPSCAMREKTSRRTITRHNELEEEMAHLLTLFLSSLFSYKSVSLKHERMQLKRQELWADGPAHFAGLSYLRRSSMNEGTTWMIPSIELMLLMNWVSESLSLVQRIKKMS